MKPLPIAMKASHCFAVLDEAATCRQDMRQVAGFFLRDTRHLSDYAWRFDGFDLLQAEDSLRGLRQFWSMFRQNEQDVLLVRELGLRPDGFDDRLELRNEAAEPVEIRLDLQCGADFVDLFELRGRRREIGRAEVTRVTEGGVRRFAYVAQDGIRSATTLAMAGGWPPFTFTLAPGEVRRFCLEARFESDLTPAGGEPPPPVLYDAATRARIAAMPAEVAQAFDDVEALALPTCDGPVIAAGVPNYVTVFGRDSLLSAIFLLPVAPDVAAATLRHLARHQGRAVDPGTAEAPGKILHEMREAELSRTGDVPFSRYYGTTDATALFVMTAHAHWHRTGDRDLLDALRPALEAAAAWLERERGEDGLLRYPADRTGRGLLHTSWKDSDDSISYADGRLAEGRIAVVEIQGYLAAALDCMADFSDLWTTGKGDGYRAAAQELRTLIETAFWNEDMGLHAVAVDAAGRHCDTRTSNPGHLLWSGVLSPERAEAVAETLLAPDMWSGWGLRTLSSGARRYKPLSYHNGSVWPHDTAIFALGLIRMGRVESAARLTRALRALARAQPGLHLPELFAGYGSDGSIPPLPYAESCRPQGWSAAALVALTLALEEASDAPRDGATGGRSGASNSSAPAVAGLAAAAAPSGHS